MKQKESKKVFVKNGVLFIMRGREKRRVPLEDICYLRAESRKIYINRGNDEFSFYGTMKELEDELKADGFIRVAKGIMVCSDQIEGYHSDKIVLKKGIEVPFGAAYRKSVLNKLGFFN